MNRDTKTMDPTLKYAVGILRGKPLDGCFYDYRIITVAGEEVAQFTNGATAKFYRDASAGAQLASLEGADITTVEAIENDDYPDNIQVQVERPDFEKLAQQAIEGDVEACQTVRQLSTERRTLGKYTKTSRATHPFLYCIKEGSLTITNFSREDVGRGWEEYFWLCQKYRELGRNRFVALWLAAELYFA